MPSLPLPMLSWLLMRDETRAEQCAVQCAQIYSSLLNWSGQGSIARVWGSSISLVVPYLVHQNLVAMVPFPDVITVSAFYILPWFLCFFDVNRRVSSVEFRASVDYRLRFWPGSLQLIGRLDSWGVLVVEMSSCNRRKQYIRTVCTTPKCRTLPKCHP